MDMLSSTDKEGGKAVWVVIYKDKHTFYAWATGEIWSKADLRIEEFGLRTAVQHFGISHYETVYYNFASTKDVSELI